MDVLVLSQGYEVLRRESWSDAFAAVWSGRAEVLATYANRVIRSATQVFPMPSVIRFLSKASARFRRKGVKFNPRNIYLRDKGLCGYCGKTVSTAEFTRDHVIPRAQGGRTVWENIVTACIPCNQRKADRTPEQAGMRLLFRPHKPKTLPQARPNTFAWEVGMPESWKDYLASMAYWDQDLSET